MRIRLGTVILTDDERRAIAKFYGETGLADRDTCRGFILDNGLVALEKMDDDLYPHAKP